MIAKEDYPIMAKANTVFMFEMMKLMDQKLSLEDIKNFYKDTLADLNDGGIDKLEKQYDKILKMYENIS